MIDSDILKLQCLVDNYLNGFKIVSVQKDPFIKGQINLFTDSTEETAFGDRGVIKFFVRNESSPATIYKEQISREEYILNKFEKWLEDEYNKSKNETGIFHNFIGIKECLNKLQEFKREADEICKKTF